MTCTKCSVELTAENWLPSSRKFGKRQCQPCTRKTVMASYYKHYDKSVAKLKQRYKKNRLKYLAQIAKRRRDNPALFKAKDKRKSVAEKLRALTAYGSVCVCCGESRYQFLSIDHMNNDGAAHRRKNNINGSVSMYCWLKRNGYPKDFQVLCMNCNCAKAWYGVCPHQTEKVVAA